MVLYKTKGRAAQLSDAVPDQMLVLVLWLVGVFVRVVRELGVVRGWSVEQEPSKVAHVVSLADGGSIAVGGARLTVLAKR